MQKQSQTNDNIDSQQVHYISTKQKPVSKILQSQQIFIDQEYEQIVVSFKNLMSQKNIKIETHYFIIQVSSKQANRVWDIQRRYSDFQWLYNALNFSYPGCILPYLPVKTIQNYMVTKLDIQYGEQSKQQLLSLRKDQLQLFLTKICKHNILKQAQQTKIFLCENKEEFNKNKKLIEGQINQSQAQESLSNGIVSIFQRGMAWIAKGNTQEVWKIQNIEGWDQMEKQIRLWIYQYSALVQKVYKLIQLKRSQAQWQGPQTQIDSVQQLKARIVSGQQYNRIFQQDLHQNIIKNIAYQTKSLKQLQSQLARRDNIISIIQYIYKFSNSSSGNNRSNKLLRKKQKFQANMSRQWPIMKQQLRYKIRSVQKKFNQIWLKYCRKVVKIWRQK